jgi:hypothetical protein
VKNFVQRVGLGNTLLTLIWAGFLAYDLVNGQSIAYLILDLAFLALTVFVSVANYRKSAPSGGTIQTFEQGETDALVNLSKGAEPVPTPGEDEGYDPEPHKLGERPDSCDICAAVLGGGAA